MVKGHFSGTSSDAYAVRFFLANHREVGAVAKLGQQVLSIALDENGQREPMTLVKVSAAAVSSKGPQGIPKEREVLGTGTGFMCLPGLVCTNFHVIERGKRWSISFPPEARSFNLDLVLADKANDLALLRIASAKESDALPPALETRPSREAPPGAEVYTIGFPFGEMLGQSHKVATGIVSAAVGIEGDPRFFQVTVPVQPGNSGGPLINENGQVVGIVSATLNVERLYREQRYIPQNVNFAIKSDYLLMLMQQVPQNTNSKPAVIAKSRTEQITMLSQSVGQITAFDE